MDTATLPFRLQRGRAVSAELPPGATDMADLVQRISAGRTAGSMAIGALYGLLPGPAVEDKHAVERAADQRMEDKTRRI
eukprot:scaffold27525_cov31-Prasinocladus_malaysianus.AAC.1